MPKGGTRAGAGRPRKHPKPAATSPVEAETTPRPRFTSAADFGLWVLNAPDGVVPMDLKSRAMQVLATVETRAAAPAEAAPMTPPNGLDASRTVRGFGVVHGRRRGPNPDPRLDPDGAGPSRAGQVAPIGCGTPHGARQRQKAH